MPSTSHSWKAIEPTQVARDLRVMNTVGTESM